MRTHKIPLFLIFLIMCFGAAAQQKVNPATQISWPAVTGAVAPTGACTILNYGQPYTNVITGLTYTCTSLGWTPPTPGTVLSGTVGQFGYYVATGTSVSGHTLSSTDIAGVGMLSNSTTGNAATATNAAEVGGVAISGTPTAGYIPVATSPTTATWQTDTTANPPFSAVANGDNTTSNDMVCDTGCSLSYANSGVINASALDGVTASSFATLTGTNIWSGTNLVNTGGSWSYGGTGTINASSLGGVAASGYPTLSGGDNTFSNGNEFNGDVIIGPSGVFEAQSAPGSGAIGAVPSTAATSSANLGSPLIYANAAIWNGSSSVYDLCGGLNNPGSGTNPNMVYNFGCSGSSGTHTIAFGNPFTAPSVNYIVSADAQSGSDIGAQINAAFAAQAGTSGSPQSGVEVDLNPNQQYSYSTAIVIPNSTSTPYITRPVLDCKGSTLTFTGTSGDGVTVMGENTFNSGEMRNCYVTFSNTAATFHLYSRPFFKMTHNTFSLGVTGITVYNDTAHGGPGYTEEQIWDSIEFAVPANSAGVTLVNDPTTNGGATGSFFYNYFRNIHFDLAGNDSIGFNLTAPSGSPTPANVVMFGSNLDLHVNAGGTGDTVIYLGTGAAVSRSTVDISGENDGSTPLYDVYAQSTTSTFFAFGKSYLTGSAHGYATGVPLSNIAWLSGPAPISDDLGSSTVATRTLSAEPQSIVPSRMCGNFQVGNVTAFLLANSAGTENDCQWEVGYRATSSGAPDVDQALTSGNPITTEIYTDSLHNVGIGPGWSTSNEPTNTLSVNGTVGVTGQVSTKLTLAGGTTQNGLALNAVGSSPQMYIGAGNSLAVSGDTGFEIYDTTNAVFPFLYYPSPALVSIATPLAWGGGVTISSSTSVCQSSGVGCAGVPMGREQVTLTTASSDSFAFGGVQVGSECVFGPANSTAAASSTVLIYIPTVVTAGTVVVNHAAAVANGAVINIVCALA